MGPESEGKRLELLKQAVPQISRVAVLWRATQPLAPHGLRELQVAASVLGVTLQPVAVRNAEDFESAFAAITSAHADALDVLQDHLFTSHRARIVDFAAKSRLPAVYMYQEWVEAGGLIAYGPNLRDAYRRVATLVDKILKGAKPSDLPVEQAMGFALAINLKTAQALGLTIPPELLFQADEIIR
jgi:putative ABC transport system substrate-binding protein